MSQAESRRVRGFYRGGRLQIVKKLGGIYTWWIEPVGDTNT